MGTVSTVIDIAIEAIKKSDLPQEVKDGVLGNLDKINPAVDLLEETVTSPNYNDIARALVSSAIGEAIAVAYVPMVVFYTSTYLCSFFASSCSHRFIIRSNPICWSLYW